VGAANAGHDRTHRFGDLHGEGADPASRTVDEDFLSALKVSFIAQSLQCGKSSDRHGCCLLEGDSLRFEDYLHLRSASIFGESSPTRAEDDITQSELRDGSPDRDNLTCDIHAGPMGF
jgi:hypothetical protein